MCFDMLHAVSGDLSRHSVVFWGIERNQVFLFMKGKEGMVLKVTSRFIHACGIIVL